MKILHYTGKNLQQLRVVEIEDLIMIKTKEIRMTLTAIEPTTT